MVNFSGLETGSIKIFIRCYKKQNNKSSNKPKQAVRRVKQFKLFNLFNNNNEKGISDSEVPYVTKHYPVVNI